MAKKELVNNDAVTLRAAEEAVDLIEDQLDAIESGIDAAEEAALQVVTVVRNNPYVLAGVLIVGLSTGAYLGYRYGIKKSELRFEARLEEEQDAMRTHFRRLYKEGMLDTPEGAVEELIPQPLDTEEARVTDAEAMRSLKAYHGKPAQVAYHRIRQDGPLSDEDQAAQIRAAERVESVGPDRTMPGETVVDTTTEVVTTNVFDAPPDEWDYKAEIFHRAQLEPDTPYVINQEEFAENEGGYEQGTLAYYAGCGTLTDEKDQPITNTEDVLGDDIPDLFGHGSGSPHIVFVRSDKLQMDWEIVKSEGTYNTDVLGFKEEGPSLRHSMQRRRRSADE